MMHKARLLAAAALLGVLPPLAIAAENTDAPGLDIVGFNGRGLFFGIEQYGLRHPGDKPVEQILDAPASRAMVPFSEIRIYDLRSGEEIHRSPFVYEVKEKIPAGITVRQAIQRARDENYFDAKRVIRYLTLVPRGKAFKPQGKGAEKTMFIAAPGLSGGLILKTFPLASKACPGLKTKGYELTLSTPGGDVRIHKDRRLPESRGCPVDYALVRAVVYLPNPDVDSLAVVVAARQAGKGAKVRYTVSGRVFDRRKK